MKYSEKGVLFFVDEYFRKLFQYGILFVFICILMFACFMNLGSVIDFLARMVDIFMPIIVGSIIAVMLNAPMRGLQSLFRFLSRKFNKTIPEKLIEMASLVLTLVGTFLLIFLVFSVVVPQVVDSLRSIDDTFNNYYPRLLAKLRRYHIDTASIENLVNYFNLQNFIKQFSDNASDIFTTALSAASSLFGVIFNGFTGFIIAVYLLAGKKRISMQAKKLLYAYTKKHTADVVCNVASLCNDTFFHFISGQCLEACILGMMFFITMSILGMPYANVISLFIGFMALIPYIGAFLGMIVGFVLILMTDPMQAIVFAIMFLILQQLEGKLIYPRVVGSSVGLPAIWTMLAALIGGSMFGIVGMVLFIPMTSVIYSLLRDNVEQQLEKKELTIE